MSSHPELADRIEAQAADLARRSIDAMYADPFWDARFGARGRAFAQEDGVHHAEYLARALRTGDASPLLKYARWLQVVLVTRGMTSRHIADNFHRLADAIRAAGLPEAGAARTMLDHAVLALRHDGKTAAAVQDASRQIAEDAVVALRGVHLGEEMIEAEWIEALEVLVSYLADSMALDRPDLLADYARWLASSGTPSVRPADPLAMLGALDSALDELREPARAQARACVSAARAALASTVRA